MSDALELPKAYDASQVEDTLYTAWEQAGWFNPDRLPDRNQKGEPFCIMMPPPNRTGTLHAGHATMLAIEDVMMRFERMRGKKALWIPGTDHAAIATQVKVEQLLMKEGYKHPREELGREKFLEKVVEFAEQSGKTINFQVRKMGSSCDWSREKYTFDDERNHAVNELFKRMHEDGLIEKGYRIVNWDPQFQTTLSDDEVLSKTVTAKLLTFKYDKDFPITIATTRSETKFGDTAVAVHPTDERYKHLVGQVFHPVFCGKRLTIKIIADEAVDPSFGTGALGVTPAHSLIDADMAVRHSLETIPVIGKDGHMLPLCGPDFAGLDIVATRQKVEETLSSQGLLVSVQDVEQNLPIAERGGAPVEQLPMEQWFIRVNKPFALRQNTLGKWKKGDMVSLKELMLFAVESKQTTFTPDRFTTTYFNWINNLRDWCISRQIWFGHRIPVWYQGDKQVVSETSPGEGWTQDPDTLDTWFSSGSWTFSTLGWPDAASVDSDGNLVKTGELAAFHPTSVLETGYDIIFFWVARMILMSTYALGEVPFKRVYLHGLVRDEQGRKMSKSLGNIIDPVEMIKKYGTDAVRLALLLGSTPGQDTKLSETKIESFRNFTNKLWNMSRFILMQVQQDTSIAPETMADQWIRARLSQVVSSVTQKLASDQLSQAGEELRDFTWSDVADWYLEIAKVEKSKSALLKELLQTLLKLWHPFMPFVTEHIWHLAGFQGDLIVAEWPQVESTATQSTAFEPLRAFVTDLRRLRAEQGVEPAKMLTFQVKADANMQQLLKGNDAWIRRLANVETFTFVDQIPQNWATVTSGTVAAGFDLSQTIDLAKERQKVEKELQELQKYITSTEGKLQNTEFTSKAPEKVIDQMKQKLDEAQAKYRTLQERLTSLTV